MGIESGDVGRIAGYGRGKRLCDDGETPWIGVGVKWRIDLIRDDGGKVREEVVTLGCDEDVFREVEGLLRDVLGTRQPGGR